VPDSIADRYSPPNVGKNLFFNEWQHKRQASGEQTTLSAFYLGVLWWWWWWWCRGGAVVVMVVVVVAVVLS